MMFFYSKRGEAMLIMVGLRWVEWRVGVLLEEKMMPDVLDPRLLEEIKMKMRVAQFPSLRQ